MGPSILTGISLTASFLAGVLALFAPCCITFLLPSYLGTIFRERRRVMYYTLIFAIGLAMILVPIAIGFRTAIYFLDQFHSTIYYVGAAIMFMMGFLTIKPILHLPAWFHVKAIEKENISTASVLGLGIMSGLTSACCAPVLLAAVTLTSLTPTTAGALATALAYVAGIVAPLIFISAGYEKWTSKMAGTNRQALYKILTKLGAAIFFATGIVIAYFNYMGAIVMNTNEGYSQWLRMTLYGVSKMFASPLVDLIIFLTLILLIYLILKRGKNETKD